MPVFMVILDVKNIIMLVVELCRDSKNPKKWAILLADGVGFICDVALSFTQHPKPFVCA